MVTIDLEKCIGCGHCAKDCFVGVLQMQDGKPVVREDCFKCGHCVAVCPKNAISITDYPMEDVWEYDESCKIDPEALLHFMQFRRSVRRFKQEKLPRKVLKTILEAGRYTPTAANLQDVSYVVVQDTLAQTKPMVWDSLKDLLARDAVLYKDKMQAFYDLYEADHERDKLFCHADTMILILADHPINGHLAATSIELLAQSMGVGVLYSGFLQRIIAASPDVLKSLGIEDGEKIRACMLFGYPDVTYRRTAPRKKVNADWR